MYSQQPNAEEARTAVEGIMDGRDYERIHEDAGAVGEVFEEAGSAYFRFLDWVARLSSEAPGMYWLLVALLLIILGLLIFHIVWTFRQALRSEPIAEGLDHRGTGRSVEQEMELALQQAIHDNAFTDALSLHFRLGLLRMARKHPGSLRPGMTNRECLVAWDETPELQGRLVQVVDLLDRKWYARQECASDEYITARRVLEDMV
jgi:hypothetical protein